MFVCIILVFIHTNIILPHRVLDYYFRSLGERLNKLTKKICNRKVTVPDTGIQNPLRAELTAIELTLS